MEEQINLELIKLQEELNLLDSAVKQIDKAGAISNSIIESIGEVQGQYSKHLQKITDKYEDYLQKANEAADEKLEVLVESHKEQIDKVKLLLSNYLELADAVSRLPEEISQIDFPVRLDRIDENISNIQQNILNTQKQIDTVEKRLKHEFKRTTDIEKYIIEQNRQIKGLKVFSTLTLLAVIAVIVIQFLPQIKAFIQ
ncbi:MAG: hypothetical protein CSA05_00515 [Bacteroidia bacterium]|nr:MAG: hypothetical protein CSB01_00195 [Bacteroidia bacterium]PIE86430.1 MAG: hypothetical protein CSA05_00515 [Bacteroidia bacterium]